MKKDLEQKKGEKTLLASPSKTCLQEDKKVMIHCLSPASAIPDQPPVEEQIAYESEAQHQEKDFKRKKKLKMKHIDPEMFTRDVKV